MISADIREKSGVRWSRWNRCHRRTSPSFGNRCPRDQVGFGHRTGISALMPPSTPHPSGLSRGQRPRGREACVDLHASGDCDYRWLDLTCGRERSTTLERPLGYSAARPGVDRHRDGVAAPRAGNRSCRLRTDVAGRRRPRSYIPPPDSGGWEGSLRPAWPRLGDRSAWENAQHAALSRFGIRLRSVCGRRPGIGERGPRQVEGQCSPVRQRLPGGGRRCSARRRSGPATQPPRPAG